MGKATEKQLAYLKTFIPINKFPEIINDFDKVKSLLSLFELISHNSFGSKVCKYEPYKIIKPNDFDNQHLLEQIFSEVKVNKLKYNLYEDECVFIDHIKQFKYKEQTVNLFVFYQRYFKGESNSATFHYSSVDDECNVKMNIFGSLIKVGVFTIYDFMYYLKLGQF